jgi:tryptophan synthase alpha chain
MVRAIRKKTPVPLLLMSYINPLFRYGLGKVFTEARKAGVDGFIIPDLILEESAEIKERCEENGLSLVMLAAPNTPERRLSEIDAASRSFVYIVSLTGVTGGRKNLPKTLKHFLGVTRRAIRNNKRFLGFGISGAEQIRRVKKDVDGVIVGSALIDLLRKNNSIAARKNSISKFVRTLRDALDQRQE